MLQNFLYLHCSWRAALQSPMPPLRHLQPRQCRRLPPHQRPWQYQPHRQSLPQVKAWRWKRLKCMESPKPRKPRKCMKFPKLPKVLKGTKLPRCNPLKCTQTDPINPNQPENVIMENRLNTDALRIVQLEKLQELKAQEKNLRELQGELERINLKIKKKDALSTDDVKYLGQLGWLSALAVTVASVAANI